MDITNRVFLNGNSLELLPPLECVFCSRELTMKEGAKWWDVILQV